MNIQSETVRRYVLAHLEDGSFSPEKRLPGFRKIAIRPQIGGLKCVFATVPTAAGPVTLKISPECLKFTAPSPSEVTFGGKTRSFPAGVHELRF